MSDYISRQAAIETLDEQIALCDKALKSFEISLKDEYAVKVERASLVAYKEQLEALPAADVAPVVHGRWTRFLYRNEKGGCVGAEMFCSECGLGNGRDAKMHYCPNCGAKMDKEKGEE